MSSHHFVKEGQEPALFIINPISLELAQPLLEWAPLVIVSSYALEEVLLWGIKIDVVLAPHTQLTEIKEKVQDQIPIKIISYELGEPPHATGFYFLHSIKQASVTIMVRSIDDSIFTFIQNIPSRPTVTLLNENMKWSFVSSGEYKKWYPVNTRIKVLGSCSGQKISIQGIDTIDQRDYDAPTDGPITIRSENDFWVGELLK